VEVDFGQEVLIVSQRVAACCSVLQRVAACCGKVALECEVGVEEEFLPGGVDSIIYFLFNATCRLLLYRRRHCAREREREKERKRERERERGFCKRACVCVYVSVCGSGMIFATFSPPIEFCNWFSL